MRLVSMEVSLIFVPLLINFKWAPQYSGNVCNIKFQENSFADSRVVSCECNRRSGRIRKHLK